VSHHGRATLTKCSVGAMAHGSSCRPAHSWAAILHGATGAMSVKPTGRELLGWGLDFYEVPPRAARADGNERIPIHDCCRDRG